MSELISIAKDNNAIAVFAIIVLFIFAIAVLAVAYFAICKVCAMIASLKGSKLKHGNTEIAIGSSGGSSESKPESSSSSPVIADNTESAPSDQGNTKRIIHLITEIIQMAEDIAWKKTKYRQDLYEQQMREVSFKLESFKNHVLLDYASVNNGNNNDIVLLILNSLIKEHIETKFESIFKADKLTENTKEKVLEANRGYFNDFDTLLISSLRTKYGSCAAINIQNFVDAITKNKDLLRENSAAALDKCYDLDAKYVEETNKLNNGDLAQRVERLINTYDKTLNEELIKQHTWSNKSAPNDVIGG